MRMDMSVPHARRHGLGVLVVVMHVVRWQPEPRRCEAAHASKISRLCA
jgi:hypothetical protein